MPEEKKVNPWVPENFANDQELDIPPRLRKPIIRDVEHPDKVDPEPFKEESHSTMAAMITDLRIEKKNLLENLAELRKDNAEMLDQIDLMNSVISNSKPDRDFLKARVDQLMGIISDVLHEAQNYPQRLVAFNSPLLGIMLLEYYAHQQDRELSPEEVQSYQKYQYSIEQRRKADVNIIA